LRTERHKSRRTTRGSLRIAVAAAALLAGAAILLFANLRFTAANPGGNDFLVHWVGTRALLLEHSSPYSDAVALEIQTLAYGRAALPGEHELRVAYPLYSALLFAPFALVGDYPLARALWMTTLELALVGFALIAIRQAGWSQSVPIAVAYLLFAVTWYHGVRPLINGNAVVIVALLLGLGLAALRARRDFAAGALFAAATIKPQVVMLLILFVGLWAVGRRRWRVLSGFLITLGLLVAASLIVLPSWPLEFAREVIRYPAYNPPGTLATALEALMPGVGLTVGRAISVGLALWLALEWVRALRGSAEGFDWTIDLTLAASCWIGVQTDPGNFVVLLLPLTAILSAIAANHARWGGAGVIGAMSLLHVGLWLLFIFTLERGAQPVQGPIMFIPLPLLIIVGMLVFRKQMRSPATGTA
jgi:Glycosyltransferase family 87